MMEFESVVRERTAVRKFKDEKIKKEQLDKILEFGRLAPTAKNIQPQKVYVLDSDDALEKINAASPCVYGAKTVLLVCSDKSLAFTKGDYSTYEMDACIVATHMMLGATSVGVDNIWIEMFDKDKVRTYFDLPDNVEPICLIPLGYRTEDYQGNPLHNVRKDIMDTVKYL